MKHTVWCLAGAAMALTLATHAQAQSFTLGYSTGFLQDPFQVIQADKAIAAGKRG